MLPTSSDTGGPKETGNLERDKGITGSTIPQPPVSALAPAPNTSRGVHGAGVLAAGGDDEHAMVDGFLRAVGGNGGPIVAGPAVEPSAELSDPAKHYVVDVRDVAAGDPPQIDEAGGGRRLHDHRVATGRLAGEEDATQALERSEAS